LFEIPIIKDGGVTYSKQLNFHIHSVGIFQIIHFKE